LRSRWYSIQHGMLAAIFLVAGTSSAAFGDETSAGVTVLRGTPARVEQPQPPQPVQLAPPPLPSCPEGYSYSLLSGYCYRPRDPLAPIPWGASPEDLLLACELISGALRVPQMGGKPAIQFGPEMVRALGFRSSRLARSFLVRRRVFRHPFKDGLAERLI
jgi:hypothetical protein